MGELTSSRRSPSHPVPSPQTGEIPQYLPHRPLALAVLHDEQSPKLWSNHGSGDTSRAEQRKSRRG